MMKSRYFVYAACAVLLWGCTRPLLAPSVSQPLRNAKEEVQQQQTVVPPRPADKKPAPSRFSPVPTPPVGATTVGADAQEYVPEFKTRREATINVDSIPLPAFINEVYGNLLELTFQIDPKIQGQKDLVTLRVPEPRTFAELYRLANQVLEGYGVSILRQGDVFNFVPVAQSASPPILTRGTALPGVPASHRPVFQLVPLKVMRNTQVARHIVSLYKAPGLKITEDPERNALFVSGSAELVARVIEAIHFFDQPLMRGRHSLRIKPMFMGVDELLEQLSGALKNEGYSVTIGVAGMVGGNVVFLPLKSRNAFIAFAMDQSVLEHVKQWVATLDVPGPPQHRRDGIFYYAVQNTKAQDLATIMRPLLQSLDADIAATQPPRNPAAATQPPTVSRLVVDKLHNALLFQGSTGVWSKLLPILHKVDKPFKQFMIEVTIAEIELSDQEELGVNWGINHNSARRSDFVTTSDLDVNGSAVLSYSLINNKGIVNATLNALMSESRLNVLSTPRVVVKSGESAMINVGNQVPVLMSQSVDPAGGQQNGNSAILQEVQYRNTGTILNITPTVHSGNRVDLIVNQVVSRALPNSFSGISSPVINNRSIKTSLSLTDGGSVLLGGLIETTANRGSSGVPILSKIPGLGRLFRSDSQSLERRELIVLIVPYILSDQDDMQEITDLYRNSLELLPEMLNPPAPAAPSR